MKKKDIENKKLYPLTPSQNAMYLMHKVSLHKQQTQIPTAFTVEEKLDFSILRKAFAVELRRNDSLRLRFIKQKGEIFQYFGDVPDIRVSVKYFFSQKEEDEFFTKDAQKKVDFISGETFRIYFFRTAHGKNGIYTNFSHLIIDAMGIMVFYLDLIRVYQAMLSNNQLPPDLYSFEEQIPKELEKANDEKKIAKHEKFYKEYFSEGGTPFYAGAHGSEYLEKFRKKTRNPEARVPMAYNPLHDKCDMAVLTLSEEDTNTIYDYCKNHAISPESVFQLGLRTHCSAINFRTDDVCMMSVCSRRSTYKEKNMSGCFAQPLIYRTILSEDMTFDDAVIKMADVRKSLYRHASYPYTKARDMFLRLFDLGPIQGANNMMFSWIPISSEGIDGMTIGFRTYNLGRYFTPLYTMIVPDTDTNGIKIYYMYRTKLINAQQIERLHENMRKTILSGIASPTVTVGELLDNIN